MGVVHDETGAPVAGATVTVTTDAIRNFRLQVKTDAKGKFSLILRDATQTYLFRIEKEGHQTFEDTVKPKIGDIVRPDFLLPTGSARPVAAPGEALPSGGQEAVLAYNEGAEAVRTGQLEVAKTKFEEALKLDPKLSPAHAALATLAFNAKDYRAAVAHAEAALAIDPGDRRALNNRYQAYKALGDAAKTKEAAEALAAADPTQAAAMGFSQGVELYNAGNIEQAQAVFEQVVAGQPDHARAHYMLGMCYGRAGDNAKAKEHLEKFIALAPNDPDVESAREMLKFL
jgi:tetratricopeptide (TPR) repeat protein